MLQDKSCEMSVILKYIIQVFLLLEKFSVMKMSFDFFFLGLYISNYHR